MRLPFLATVLLSILACSGQPGFLFRAQSSMDVPAAMSEAVAGASMIDVKGYMDNFSHDLTAPSTGFSAAVRSSAAPSGAPIGPVAQSGGTVISGRLRGHAGACSFHARRSRSRASARTIRRRMTATGATLRCIPRSLSRSQAAFMSGFETVADKAAMQRTSRGRPRSSPSGRRRPSPAACPG